MKAVYLTAGAAGMYCGSCMHDNALARALRTCGVDCLLQPVYTPIRTDEESVARPHLFFGGIHIYLLQQLPWLRWIPAPLRRVLDWQPLITAATRRSHSTDAARLGALAVSMLKGTHGNQADEVARLADWLSREIRPNAVLFTNLLIGGVLPELRRQLPTANLVVLLQGDDIFLEYLPPRYRDEAISLCRTLAQDVDRFVTHSRFYADKMGRLLQLPQDKITVTPLSIDTAPLESAWKVGRAADGGFRLGYLARIAPEKGLHNLVDAFIRLAADHPDLTLHAAGWLGETQQGYLEAQQAKIAAAGLTSRFQYHGSPSLQEKVLFLRSLDLFSVPTDYEDPKGLFVLEALAAGVPVVQPHHGAFAELLESTGGGMTYPAGDVDALCAALVELKTDHDRRRRLAETGLQRVIAQHGIATAAERMKEILFPK